VWTRSGKQLVRQSLTTIALAPSVEVTLARVG
jgi:hypothetical protein